MSEPNKPENEQQYAVPVSSEPTVPKWIPVLPCDFVPAQEAPARSVHDKFSLERAFAAFNPELEVDTATRELWGIVDSLTDGGPLPAGVFTFEEAVKQPWCKAPDGNNRRVCGLYRLCKSLGCYPPLLLERRLITEIGFDRALQLQREKDKERDTQGTRRRRAAKRKDRLKRSSS